MERDERRGRGRGWSRGDGRQALAGPPVTEEQLEALLESLEAALEGSEECDGSFRLVEAWLRSQGLAPGSVIPLLRRLGGHCDCEVHYNVRPAVLGSWA
jgi:hypothetical protein